MLFSIVFNFLKKKEKDSDTMGNFVLHIGILFGHVLLYWWVNSLDRRENCSGLVLSNDDSDLNECITP